MMIGMGSDFWGNSLFTLPTKQYILESEWLETSIKIIPLIFSLSGATLAFIHYLFNIEILFKLKQTFIGRYLYIFLNRKWLFDKVYNENISQNLLRIAYTQTYQNMDRGVLEFLGPEGISTQLYLWTQKLASIQFGMIFHNLFGLFLGLFILLFFFLQGPSLSLFIDFKTVLIFFIFILLKIKL
jgi:NADH-ubiquinone oxidoreductase chain 5